MERIRRITNKIAVFMIVVDIALNSFTLQNKVNAEYKSGTCGENLIWQYSSDNKILSISGQGEMKDYALYGSDIDLFSPWFDIKEDIEIVCIGDGVTDIGSGAFQGCINLTQIVFSNSISKIKKHAFFRCSSLKEITIPNNVTSIGEGAFEGCTHLLKVNFNNNLNNIGNYAFKYCENLKEINISNGIESIGCSAFRHCNKLGKVIINGNPKMGGGVFNDCTVLKEVYIKGNATIDYTLEEGKHIFRNCTLLETIEIPSTFIETDQFYGCLNLKNIKINSPLYVCINNIVFSSDKKELVWYPPGLRNTKYVIPESVTAIGWGAFYGQNYLEEVVFSKNVSVIKQGAFMLCKKINNISIPSTVGELPAKCFYGCENLTSIYIPSSVKDIVQKGNQLLSTFENIMDSVTLLVEPNSYALDFALKNEYNYKIVFWKLDNISISSNQMTYTGEAFKPTIVIKDGNTTLKNGTDYTLSYSNNINAGTGKVIITGKGNYTGSVTKTFTISKASYSPNVQEYKGIYDGKNHSISILGVKGGSTIKYSTNNKTWTTTNPVRKNAGTTTIYYQITHPNFNTITGNKKIVIDKKTQSIKGSTSYKKTKGSSFKLGCKANTKLSYKTSNKKIVTVNSNGKVTLKGYGKATITIKAATSTNYRAVSKKITITSIPKKIGKISIKKNSKQALISWAKDKEMSGYNVEYARNKSFKGKKSGKVSGNKSATINISKGKTYYVRIRRYKKVSGKKYYSEWYKIKFKA